MDLGISTLFQELNVVNQLTVEENLILGREPNRYGVIQRSDPSGKSISTYEGVCFRHFS